MVRSNVEIPDDREVSSVIGQRFQLILLLCGSGQHISSRSQMGCIGALSSEASSAPWSESAALAPERLVIE